MKAWMRPVLELTGILLFVSLVVHPTCNVLFRCGCRMIGFGGTEPCNIHHATEPDCPWCVMSGTALLLVGVVLVAGTWVGGHRKQSFSWVGGLLGYAMASLVASAVSAWATDYPKWLFFGS
ncbi:MAG: hypothetical protein AAF627_16915 [Myxococcota bacterium]